MKQILLLLFSVSSLCSFSAQKNLTTKPLNSKEVKPISQKIPLPLLIQILDSTQNFVVNDQTKFAHIDVPVSKYNQFLGFIKDSVAVEVPNTKSLVYYNFILKNGNIVNCDIYWTDKKAYIVFAFNGKKYFNVFTLEGAQFLKSIFKL